MSAPEGISVADVQRALGVDYSTAWRYIQELGAKSTTRGLWALEPGAEDVALAHAILERAL